MPAINWDTVVTSGATAVFVTLAIEYLVKPRMEARKDRILGALRARQELLSVITALTLAGKMYGEELPATARPDLQRAWAEERDRQYVTLQTRSRQLIDNVALYAHAYPRQLDDVLMGYVTTVHGIMISMRPRHKKAAQIAALGIPMAGAVYVPPLWRVPSVVAMVRAQNEVRRLIAKIQQDSEPEVTPVEAAARRDPLTS